jgi:hypothetical protein
MTAIDFDFSDILEEVASEVEAKSTILADPPKRYNSVVDLFADAEFANYMRLRWPIYAQNANNLCLQNGKLGQECGKMRERALIYLLARFLGEDAERCYVDDNSMDVVERGKDVILFGRDVSIKTISYGGNGFNQLKISWVENTEMASEVQTTWRPQYDLFLCRLRWESDIDGMYYISKSIQDDVLFGNNFLRTSGGYSKGTSISNAACELLVTHPGVLKLAIPMPPEHRDDNYLTKIFDSWYTNSSVDVFYG